MMTFKEWLFLVERGSSTGTRGKIGLYPPLYTQVFNYAPQDVVTWSADAITYMSEKDVNPTAAYSNWGNFKPYMWQHSGDTPEAAPQKDPNKIPKSLM